MWTEKELSTILESVNPLPDPETLPDHGDRLWANLQDKTNAPSTRPLYSRRAVLVVAAVVMLIAVPAVAMLWGDKPPLDREFAPGISEMVVYGPDEGVDEYCAWRMDFTSSGAPVVGGSCGALRFEGNEWHRIMGTGDFPYPAVADIAVAPDGTVWVADVDRGLQSSNGDSVTNHGFSALAVEITTDGTVWAARMTTTRPSPSVSRSGPALVSYDGTAWVVHDVGIVVDLLAGPDGALWTLGFTPIENGPATQGAQEWEETLGRFIDGNHTTDLLPGGSDTFESLTLAPDGALWMIRATDRIVMRDGVSDTEWELVRFDGFEWTTLVVPFAEPNDVAVHPDGTVWASSSLYGVFAYGGAEWIRYGTEEGLPSEEVSFVEIGPDGSIFVGTRLGVARITPNAG
jgi:hypothetical protein